MASPAMMREIRIKVGSCDKCGTIFKPEVLCNPNGMFYVGTACKCGPFTRESEYFATRGEAEDCL